MPIRVMTEDEKDTTYPSLFKSIFGFEDKTGRPQTAIVHENEAGEIRGFITGVVIDSITFYLLWGGSLDGFKGHRHVWAEGQRLLQDYGFEYITTKTPQDNVVWQRMLLALGFYIYGVQYSGGKLSIEFMKYIKEQ